MNFSALLYCFSLELYCTTGYYLALVGSRRFSQFTTLSKTTVGNIAHCGKHMVSRNDSIGEKTALMKCLNSELVRASHSGLWIGFYAKMLLYEARGTVGKLL
jgi:hypothetical protein